MNLINTYKNNTFLKSLAAITAVGFIYFNFLTPTEYTSESKFVIKKAGEENLQPMSFGIFPGAGDSNDVPVIKAYVESPNAASDLDKISFRSHISDHSKFLGGLSKNDPFEDYYQKFIDLVQVKSDYSDQVITLNVSAYTPEMAQKANEELLKNIEAMVNSINEDKIQAQFENSERIAKEAEEKLNNAVGRLMALQTKQRSINPESERVSINETLLKLESELVVVQTELKEKRSYLSDSSLDVRSLRSRESALQEKIEDIRNNIPSLTPSALSQKLKFEVERLTEIYKAAVANVDQKRIEAGKDAKIVVIVAEPMKPQTKSYPLYTKDLLNFVLLGMVFVFIFKFLILSIKNKR